MDLLDRLLEHDRWATARLFELCGGLDDDRLDQEFDVGHRTLRQTFMHMTYNVAAWTGQMTGERDVVLPDSRSMTALGAWDISTYDTFAAFARRMRDGGRFDDTFTDDFDGQMTYGGAILHVILHNEGHRTEAVHILTRLGVPGNQLELDHALWDYVRRGLFDPDAAA